MDLDLRWPEIALRLLLAAAAGATLGFDREEHGHSAGLRTTLLVTLAAALSMLQANLLLGMTGKTPASFAVMDLMRLPLGVLSGMGFIGAGAILRRENLVIGVTTAATLWYATMMGLCFGGGQLGLGLAALGIGVMTLWGLKAIELRLHRSRKGAIHLTGTALDPAAVAQAVEVAGAEVTHWRESRRGPEGLSEQAIEVSWQPRDQPAETPPFLDPLARLPGMIRVDWKPTAEVS